MGPMMMATAVEPDSAQSTTQTTAQPTTQASTCHAPLANGNHSSGNVLDRLEEKLSQVITTSWETMLGLYESSSMETLIGKANLLVDYVKEIDELKDRVDTTVPVEAIEFLCGGKNPDHFMANYVQEVMNEDRFMNSKTEAIQDFRGSLVDQLRVVFPEATEAYEPSGDRNR